MENEEQEKPHDEIDSLMSELGIGDDVPTPDPSPSPVSDGQALDLEEFTIPVSTGEGSNINMIKDVDLKVKIELGRAEMTVHDVLQLSSGSVVELDKLTGDPLDICVNDRLIARGEVIVINDLFAIRITEVITPES